MVYVYSYHYNIEAALPIQKEKTTDSSQGDSKWLRVSFCALSTKLIVTSQFTKSHMLNLCELTVQFEIYSPHYGN